MALQESLPIETHRDKDVLIYGSASSQLMLATILLKYNSRTTQSIHKISGFSIDSQFLWIMALVIKYEDVLPGIPDEWNDLPGCDVIGPAKCLIWEIYCHFIMLVLGFIVSVIAARGSEDKFDGYWVAGGIISSYLLAVDKVGIDLTEKDRWMFGSYLGTIAWIPHYKLHLKKAPNGVSSQLVTCLHFCILLYDVATIAGYSYDYSRHGQYGNIGYRLVVLKLLFFCVFAVRFCLRYIRAPKN